MQEVVYPRVRQQARLSMNHAIGHVFAEVPQERRTHQHI
jgi:hypothetical protein